LRAVPAAIRPAVTAADWGRARELFRDYEREIDSACCFEGFERELAELDRRYAAPGGRLLLVWSGGEAVGCAAFRVTGPGVAEGKRLYLRPQARGAGLGGALVVSLLEEARAAGVRTFRIETLPGKMSVAVAMYRGLRFREVPPWVKYPILGALYLERTLPP
jgi:GNAT superfamily N-acetyltransferase